MHRLTNVYLLNFELMRIFLIGFMGAGKSFLGEMWGAAHSIPFFDLDKLIEEEERTSVENIFSSFGEEYFREKEAAILRNTDRFQNCIIACGGGTPCFFDNMQWMNKNGITVFLNETPALIFEHLKNHKKIRPLIAAQTNDSLKLFIENKLQQRLPFYLQCSIILSGNQLNKDGFQAIQNFL